MPMEASLVFPDGLTEGVIVTRESERLYWLEEQPIFSDAAQYGDLIRCSKLGENRFEFQEVVEQNSLKRYSGIFSSELLDAPEVREVLERIMSSGGYWQRDMGGCLSVFFDPRVYDPKRDLKRALHDR